jgi:hypothetical protein
MSGQKIRGARKGAQDNRNIGSILNARHDDIENSIFNGFRNLPRLRQQRILGQLVAWNAASESRYGSSELGDPKIQPTGKKKGEPTIPRKHQIPAVSVDDRILPIKIVSILRGLTRQERSTNEGQNLLTVISVVGAAWRRCMKLYPEGKALKEWKSTIQRWPFDLRMEDSLSSEQINVIRLSFLSEDARKKTLERIKEREGKVGEPSGSPKLPIANAEPKGSALAEMK